jgi:His-Xaa-Ser system protein HxsD
VSDRAAVSELRFSRKVYRLETIKKAAYRLSGRCSFDFSVEDDDIVCRLIFREGTHAETAGDIEYALRNEVLDQDLRETIAEETEPIRNAVLAYAFSRTGLQNGEPL